MDLPSDSVKRKPPSAADSGKRKQPGGSSSSSSSAPKTKKRKVVEAKQQQPPNADDVCLAAVLFHALRSSGTGTPFPEDNMLAYAGQIVLLFAAARPSFAKSKDDYAATMHGWIMGSEKDKKVDPYEDCTVEFAQGFRRWASQHPGGQQLLNALSCGKSLKITECISAEENPLQILSVHIAKGIPEQLKKLFTERLDLWRSVLITIIREAQAQRRPQILMALVIAWHPYMTPLGLLAETLINTMFFASAPEKHRDKDAEAIAEVLDSQEEFRHLMNSRPHTRGLLLWQLMSDMVHTSVFELDNRAMRVEFIDEKKKKSARTYYKLAENKERVRPLLIRDRPKLFPKFAFYQSSRETNYQSLLNVSYPLSRGRLVPAKAPNSTSFFSLGMRSSNLWLSSKLFDTEEQLQEQYKVFIKHRLKDQQFEAVRNIASQCDFYLARLGVSVPTVDEKEQDIGAVIASRLANDQYTIWPRNKMLQLLVNLSILSGHASKNLAVQLEGPEPSALMGLVADRYPSFIVSPILHEEIDVPEDKSLKFPFEPNYGTTADVSGRWTQFAQTLGTQKCTDPVLKLIQEGKYTNLQCGLLVYGDGRHFIPMRRREGTHRRLQYHLLPVTPKESPLLPLKTVEEVLGGGGTLAPNSNLFVWSQELSIRGNKLKLLDTVMMSFICDEIDSERGNRNIAHITLTRIADLLRAQFEFLFGERYDGSLAAQARLLRHIQLNKRDLCDFRVQEYLESQREQLLAERIDTPSFSLENLDMLLGKADPALVDRAQKAAEMLWDLRVDHDKTEAKRPTNPEQVAMLVLLREGLKRQQLQQDTGMVNQLRQRLAQQHAVPMELSDRERKLMPLRDQQRGQDARMRLAELRALALEMGATAEDELRVAMDIAPDEAGRLIAAAEVTEAQVESDIAELMKTPNEQLSKAALEEKLRLLYEGNLQKIERDIAKLQQEMDQLQVSYDAIAVRLKNTDVKQVDQFREAKAANDEISKRADALSAEITKLKAEQRKIKEMQAVAKMELQEEEDEEESGAVVAASGQDLDLTGTIDDVCRTFNLPGGDYETRIKVLRILQRGPNPPRSMEDLEEMANDSTEAINEWFNSAALRRFNLVRLVLQRFKAKFFAQDVKQEEAGGSEGKPLFPPLCAVFDFGEGQLERTLGRDDDPPLSNTEKTDTGTYTLRDDDEEMETEQEKKQKPKDRGKPLDPANSDDMLWEYAMNEDAAAAARAWAILLHISQESSWDNASLWKSAKREASTIEPEAKLSKKEKAKQRLDQRMFDHMLNYDHAWVIEKWDGVDVEMSSGKIKPELLAELYPGLEALLVMTLGAMPLSVRDAKPKAQAIIKAINRLEHRLARAYAIVSVFEWCQWCHALVAIYKRGDFLRNVWAGALDSCVDGATACVPRYHIDFQQNMTAHLELQVLAMFVERPFKFRTKDFKFAVHANFAAGDTERMKRGWAAYNEFAFLPKSEKPALEDDLKLAMDMCKQLWPMLHYNNPRDLIDARLLSRLNSAGAVFRSPDAAHLWSPCREAFEATERKGGRPYLRWEYEAWFDLAEAMRTEVRCIQVCHRAAKQTGPANGAYLFVSLLRLAEYKELYELDKTPENEAKIRDSVLRISLGLRDNLSSTQPRIRKLTDYDPRPVLDEIGAIESKLAGMLLGRQDKQAALVGWVYGRGRDQQESRSNMIGHGVQHHIVQEVELDRRLGELARRCTSPGLARYLHPTSELFWYKSASSFSDKGLDVDDVNLACRLPIFKKVRLIFLRPPLVQFERTLGDIRSLAAADEESEQLLGDYEFKFVEPLWQQLVGANTMVAKLHFLTEASKKKQKPLEALGEGKQARGEPAYGEGKQEGEGKKKVVDVIEMSDDEEEGEPVFRRRGKGKRGLPDEPGGPKPGGGDEPKPEGGGAEPMDQTKGRVRMFR